MKPLIDRLPPVHAEDVDSPVQVARALNTIIAALNQLLPGRGSLVIDDEGHVALRTTIGDVRLARDTPVTPRDDA